MEKEINNNNVKENKLLGLALKAWDEAVTDAVRHAQMGLASLLRDDANRLEELRLALGEAGYALDYEGNWKDLS